MLRNFVFVIVALMLSGCVSTKVDRKSEDAGQVKTLRFGVALSASESGPVIVSDVANGSPAQKAGIEAGDTLLSVDEHTIRKRSDFLYVTSTKKANMAIVFRVSRRGKIMNCEVTPAFQKVLSCAVKIEELLYEDKLVRLAIVIGEISNATVNYERALQSWKEGVRSQMLAEEEGSLISSFGRERNFAVIDRSSVDKLISELKLEASGLSSKEVANKLGELYGVTYMLIESLSRFSSDNHKAEDVQSIRLVEVSTGRVIASDVLTTRE